MSVFERMHSEGNGRPSSGQSANRKRIALGQRMSVSGVSEKLGFGRKSNPIKRITSAGWKRRGSNERLNKGRQLSRRKRRSGGLSVSLGNRKQPDNERSEKLNGRKNPGNRQNGS